MADEEFKEISFYIVAHADDCQLFMQPNIYNDLVATDSKVVCIITTAGDAGANKTYWAAREEGLKSSLRFCLAPLAALSQFSGTKRFNDHAINYWSVNNATCYFLRLPDGNLDGNGFSAQHYQSLTRLKERQIRTITAVDNSATYSDWLALYTTLHRIILSESYGMQNIWINYLNPDTRTNPNDHADHIATGQAIQAMPVISGLHQALFTGYNIGNGQENLHLTDLFWKIGMFATYEKTVFDSSGYSTLHEDIDTYQRWCLNSPKFITTDP